MFITPHMLVGAAIGSQTSNIWSVLFLGLASHYLLDFIPHWDYLTKIELKLSHLSKIGLDFALGSFLIILLSWSFPNKFLIFFGVGIVLLPDILEFLYQNYKIRWLKKISWFHQKIHYQENLCFPKGITFSSGIAVLALFILHWG